MKLDNKRIITFIFFGLGILALILLIREVTVTKLLNQLYSFGPAFGFLLIIEILSNAFSNFGWYYSFKPAHRPPYSRLLFTGLASLSVSGALPSGQAGEFFKANMLRGYTKNTEIVSSLLLYNYLHVLTTSLVVFVAALVAFISGMFEFKVALIALIVAFVVLLVTALLAIVLRAGLLEKVFVKLRQQPVKILRPSEQLIKSASEVDDRLKNFSNQYPGDLLKGGFWLIIGRLFSIMEVAVIMYKLDLDYSAAAILMVFATTSLANYMLMVLPAREGFLEGSTYMIFKMIGFNPANGFSLEIIRRLRKMFFQVTGLVIMLFIPQIKSEMIKPQGNENDV